MLTTLEVFIYFAVLFVFPITVYSLVNGSPPPPQPWFNKYYKAEKHLLLVGNLFVLSICFMAAVRLALHFGLIEPDLRGRMDWMTQAPFTFLFFVYLAMWIRAAIKVRRAMKSQA